MTSTKKACSSGNSSEQINPGAPQLRELVLIAKHLRPAFKDPPFERFEPKMLQHPSGAIPKLTSCEFTR